MATEAQIEFQKVIDWIDESISDSNTKLENYKLLADVRKVIQIALGSDFNSEGISNLIINKLQQDISKSDMIIAVLRYIIRKEQKEDYDGL